MTAQWKRMKAEAKAVLDEYPTSHAVGGEFDPLTATLIAKVAELEERLNAQDKPAEPEDEPKTQTKKRGTRG